MDVTQLEREDPELVGERETDRGASLRNMHDLANRLVRLSDTHLVNMRLL
jgi:hypothetical protein